MNPVLSPINYSNIENDITSDGSIYKEVLSSDNEWLSPEPTNNVNIEYKVNNLNSISYTGLLNKLDDYLVTCVSTMTRNEVSFFKVKSELIKERYPDLTDEYTSIEIKLLSFNEIVDINKDIQKIILQEGTDVKYPLSPDIVNIRLVKLDSITDIYNMNYKTQLENVNIESHQIYLYTDIEGLKDTLVTMRQNEVCYFKHVKDDKCTEYLIELCSWDSVLMFDMKKNIYAKIIKKIDTHLFDIPVYDTVLEYQIADTYEDLDNNTTTHNVGEHFETNTLDKCMANMKIGEECILYEEHNKQRYIRLLNITTPPDPSKLSPIEKYKYAVEKKEKGNKLYLRGEYGLAIGHYTGGLEGIKVVEQTQLNEDKQEIVPINPVEKELELIQCDETPQDDNEIHQNDQSIDVQKLYSNLHLNISMCNLKLNRYRDVINSCKEAIRFDDKSPKLFYRMGYSYLQLNELENAEKYLKQANILNETSVEIKRAFLQLKKCKIETKKKEKELYGGKLLQTNKSITANDANTIAIKVAKEAATSAIEAATLAVTAAKTAETLAET